MGEGGVVGDGGTTSESGDDELWPLLEVSPSECLPLGVVFPGGFSEMGEKVPRCCEVVERLAVETAEEGATTGEGEEEGLGDGVQRSESPSGAPPSSSPSARNGSSLGIFTANSTLQDESHDNYSFTKL